MGRWGAMNTSDKTSWPRPSRSKVEMKRRIPEPVIDSGWVCRRYAPGAHADIIAQLLRSGRISVDDVDHAHWESNRANYLREAEEAARKMAMLDDMIDQHLSRGELAAAALCAEESALLQSKRDCALEGAAQCQRIFMVTKKTNEQRL